jgi:steroid delta-isomerase-like uncharacterized protein
LAADDNMAKSRRFMEEAFNKGNMKAVDEFMSANFVEHDPFPGQGPGLQGFKQGLTAFRQAFPDLHVGIDDMIADGEKVVIRSTMKGTHKGTFMNMPPTGKQISVEGIDIVRISGGKAVEHWGLTDTFTMMQQLGAIPTP